MNLAGHPWPAQPVYQRAATQPNFLLEFQGNPADPSPMDKNLSIETAGSLLTILITAWFYVAVGGRLPWLLAALIVLIIVHILVRLRTGCWPDCLSGW
ncbi:MAG: hypothetical protein HQL59_03090 [Magnetococcales bacterium]|nr:hypothetical protein [Magnetococcales bacterium]